MTALVSLERFGALLRKEKDGASRPNHFWADSLNAFIPRFAGVEGIFCFHPHPRPRPRPHRRNDDDDEDDDEDEFFFALVFQLEKLSAEIIFRADKIERSAPMKIRSLAIASLFAVSAAHASTTVERFTTDPLQSGWQIFGGTNLFQWDSTNQVLDVTWDSTQPNSYFYLPLGQTLTITDSFCVVIDLQLNDALGTGYSSELGIGLLNFSDATNANYLRTYGTQPNVCEFDYFPADDYGDPASEDAALVDSEANFYFSYDNLTLNSGVTCHILLLHQANTAIVSGEIFTNAQLLTSLPNVFSDIPTNDSGAFQLDTLSISSYAGNGFGDILAHGSVSKIAVASPLPVQAIQNLAPGQIQFASDTNWFYTLEQSSNFQDWTPAAPATFGNGTNLILPDTNPQADKSFYRVRADLP